VHSFEFAPSTQLIDFLEQELINSAYKERYGNHIENRSSMVNFSVVGRNAIGDQRTRYYEWDKLSRERLTLAEKINVLFPEVSAQAGGETGIDIIPAGKDKRQVIQYMNTNKVYFLGDRLDEGGNDKPLADALANSDIDAECIHVKSWSDTWEVLQDVTSKVFNTRISV
jgi:phosphomannomutase